MECLKGMSEQDMIEIHCNLNGWEWDSRLGEKPKYFDDMPNRDRTSKFDKYSKITPIMKEIEKRTSERSRLKHHHLYNLERTRIQFEIWWIKRLFRKKLYGY
ncbi:hypothetical protein Pryu01_03009 [Paraliobacillus ryukyuensis]|uniref:Uncharacterized protein n=1 Tax=Paraliobacillus ryukyuensis TaxID=200904 RepID=A0A366DRF0_9BACI|nr:hypothetical protein [Paraliobacillus ryukyuensis]RBO92059.1 hypothetical protein DES48_11723 [Paraliobacillus ryukyuensis]